MNQGEHLKKIAITLQDSEEAMLFITLSMGVQHATKLHLSLQEARELASNIIQHVHLAEVKNSLKKNRVSNAINFPERNRLALRPIDFASIPSVEEGS